ncbi:MAG: YggS family pyridoxal phosphate-dependent enzyme [Clostridiales bacterium]|jgi:pyridoxal phosphate enzyme (YggS family)|nr:YggS family pyridoxal phosphate-dependent enzyme [Clostridiales bacterium]
MKENLSDKLGDFDSLAGGLIPARDISLNVKRAFDDVESACVAAGREPLDVTLLIATKYANVEQINQAIASGVKVIGENRVQQLLEHYEGVACEVSWHFIGRLQTNKVKYIIDKVDLIHSVDSIKLATEIDACAKKIGKVQDILIQVNLFDEESKGGVGLAEFDELIKNAKKLENIRICGLMYMPPQQIVTQMLHKCKDFYLDFCEKMYNNKYKGILSFGTSGDFALAIKYGSTIVRLGRSVFYDNAR